LFSLVGKKPSLLDKPQDINIGRVDFSVACLIECIREFKSSCGPRSLIIVCDSKLFQEPSDTDIAELETALAKFSSHKVSSPQEIPGILDLIRLSILCNDVPYLDGVLLSKGAGFEIKEKFKCCDVLLLGALSGN